MPRRGYNPDIITYTELIKGYCMKGKIEVAEKIFVKIQESGLPIDHILYQLLMKKYFKMGALAAGSSQLTAEILITELSQV
ncbi:hypothetical protein LguiA_036634 [Lonicera macranthoides]